MANGEFQFGDAPIEQAYINQMKGIAQALDEVFNGDKKHPDKETGFVLMVFRYGLTWSRDSKNLRAVATAAL